MAYDAAEYDAGDTVCAADLVPSLMPAAFDDNPPLPVTLEVAPVAGDWTVAVRRTMAPLPPTSVMETVTAYCPGRA